MALYDKSVRDLMREDLVEGLNLDGGRNFYRRQLISWFGEHYPKVKQGTITAHLIRLTTNAPSRTHYHAKPGEDDVFYQIDRGRFRLYDADTDPEPINTTATASIAGETATESELEPDETTDGNEFAYERDLQNFLSRNLNLLEPGLRLYEDEGVTGTEFPVGGRFVDILAKDDRSRLVVIELKVSRGYDRVVGQILRYISWIQKNQAEEGQEVRGIIIAREITEDLILACENIPFIDLYQSALIRTHAPIYAARWT